MNSLHVAVGVLNQTPLAWSHNLANVQGAIAEARAQGISLLCLPELCLTGYGCEDAFHSADVQRRAWQSLQELIPTTRGLIVAVGLPVRHQNAVFNVAALIADGQLLGLVGKQFLAGDGIHYEPRWFKPWPAGVRVDFQPPVGPPVPLGDLIFDIGGVRLGFEICEDAWVATRPGATLSGHAVDFLLNPSASHFAFGKNAIRHRFVLEGSRAFGATYLYANLLGNESGRILFDGGGLIASGGRWMAQGSRFSFADRQLTSAWIDVETTRLGQSRSASFRPVLGARSERVISADFPWPKIALGAPPPRSSPVPTWETGPHLKEEEFTRAVGLGLFDYLRKSASKGYLVSLSGGADSAAVSCLCADALALAVNELGAEGARERLTQVPGLTLPAATDAWVGALLTTVYQATENSGPVTRDAARQLAQALGAHHHELDLTELHRAFRSQLEVTLGRPLTWATDDVALQNLQARLRSPGAWLLANVQGALLLTTSNRSEAAVGYATMDGDTSGGLSPLSGIDKHFLRHWLRWRELHAPEGLTPQPALAAVNRQAPTAELRPPSAHQTDEDDLMPYDLLDTVERFAIRDQRSPLEVWQLVVPTFPQHSPARLALWVERFFRLWSRNQWKRERYAPGFHLDDENLDPKTWCRWPILSGGFEAELNELRHAAARAETPAAGSGPIPGSAGVSPAGSAGRGEET